MSNLPHFMCGSPFPSQRWYTWSKREETSRRGQFYSEVNIWFWRVRFRLPLVEKYMSEYHFLIDFPNRETDAKHEVKFNKWDHFRNNQYSTVMSIQKIKGKQSQEKRSLQCIKKVVFPHLVALFADVFSFGFLSLPFTVSRRKTWGSVRILEYLGESTFSKRELPGLTVAKLQLSYIFGHHTETDRLTHTYCVYTVIWIKTELEESKD